MSYSHIVMSATGILRTPSHRPLQTLSTDSHSAHPDLCPHVEAGHHEALPPPAAGQGARPRGQAAVLHPGV